MTDTAEHTPTPTRADDIAAPPLSVIPTRVFQLENVGVSYSGVPAVDGVSFDIRSGEVTALIGPSGCGKSTLLRCLNRMNDLIPTAEVNGIVTYRGHDLYAPDVDPVAVRRHIGMVFQKPNPFPKSIYDNVAYGLRVVGDTRNLDDRVEEALRHAALWDEVSGRLNESALSLSGGQQQRLCIARAIASRPSAILMDEPCSALDPHATARIETLIAELKGNYTIVIVTHNMAQARRVADQTVFLTTRANARGETCGELVEAGPTETIFTNPADGRTHDYVHGVFG